MSVIQHNLYRDLAPSFEALLREFVIDPGNLDPKTREDRRNKLLGYYRSVYDKVSIPGNKNRAVRKAYAATRKWAQEVFVQHHMKKAIESNVDIGLPTLDSTVWDTRGDKYVLKPSVQAEIYRILRSSPFGDLLDLSDHVHIVGSLTTNTYTETSDLDVHLSPNKEKLTALVGDKKGYYDKTNLEEDFQKKVKKWSWDSKLSVGKHPIEVYIQYNYQQDFLGDGVYNVKTAQWLKGPLFREVGFNPYAVHSGILKSLTKEFEELDVELGSLKRSVIDFRTIVSAVRKIPAERRGALIELLRLKLEEINSSVDDLLKNRKEWTDARRNASKPTSIEQAFNDVKLASKWGEANAYFKFIDRYMYIKLIGEIEKIVGDDDVETADVDMLADVLGVLK